MSGLGAWSYGFYSEGMSVPDERVAAGILAFKKALIANSCFDGIDLDSGKFGHSMSKMTKKFQKMAGITVDGVIGPTTARHLFQAYTFPEEAGGTIEIPDHLLQKLGEQESGHDPVAQGWSDPEDEGWAQINLPSHPGVSRADAWRPEVAIPWAGSYVKKFYVNEFADFEVAVASYNLGSFYAKKWGAAGKPSSGGPVVGGVDVYRRATLYVAGVKSQPV